MKYFFIIVFIIGYTTGCVSTKNTLPVWKTLPAAPNLPQPDESGYAPVNGIKMYYAVFNKDGKDPVLLLHGGFSSSADWGFEVPLLAKTHKVIIADTRGHGRSSMNATPFTYKLFTEDVIALLNYLKIKRTSIVGWSDGGIIGLMIAILHPSRINKLFTFGANYNRSGEKSDPPDTAMMHKFMAKVTANYKLVSPTPDSFGVLRSAIIKMYDKEPDISPKDLMKIEAPTVIAYGQYEQFYKPEHFEEMVKLIPGAKLVVIPNVSHGGPLQNPRFFHNAILKLLNN
jgi:pimeloyl-ACP methyl ester carboxylesterase